MFAYSAPLLMQGDWTAIVISLADALLGIFIGTLAVVGYFMSPIPLLFRIGYGLVAAMILMPSTAFAGANIVSIVGVVAGLAAIGYEIMRGRSPDRLSTEKPALPT